MGGLEVAPQAPRRSQPPRHSRGGARNRWEEDAMTDADLGYTPAVELAALIRERKLSPVELTRAVLARIEALNPALKAFCTPTPDLALAEARRAEDAVLRGDRLGAL